MAAAPATTAAAARPWYRETIPPPRSTLSRTSSMFSKGSGSGNANIHTNDPLAAWKIAAVFAAISSGVCFDRLGTITENDDGGSTDDDDDNHRIFGAGMSQGPLVARMTKRRDTSIQIRFGDSVLLDHVEPLSSTTVAGTNGDEDIVLLLPEDKETISPFLYYLMTQVELVRVQKDDAHNLPIGLPGLGCAHCRSSRNRQTTTRCRSEVFPLDRRTFPAMVRKSLYNHIRRCDRCPVEVKLELRRLKNLEIGTKISREERQFFKKLWFRMGHKEVI
jgi:hypothetical protein